MFSCMLVAQANMGRQWRDPNCLFFLAVPLLREQLEDLRCGFLLVTLSLLMSQVKCRLVIYFVCHFDIFFTMYMYFPRHPFVV